MKYLVNIVVFALLATLSLCRNCFKSLPFYTTEEEISKEVDSLLENAEKKNEQISEDCLQFLIKKGYHY